MTVPLFLGEVAVACSACMIQPLVESVRVHATRVLSSFALRRDLTII